MNLDDPPHDIRHLQAPVPASTRSIAERSSPCTALPTGYANTSPQTRLQRRAIAVPADPLEGPPGIA